MQLNRRHFAGATILSAGGMALAGTSAWAQPSATSAEKKLPDAIIELAEYCHRTKFDDLPASVVDATKKQILDTLGVAIAGINEQGVSQLRELALETGGQARGADLGIAPSCARA